MNKQQVVLVLMTMSVGCALAKPYYYFQEAGEAVPKTSAELGNQVQQAAGQVQEAVGGGDANSPMPQRLTSHLGQLYSHGSTAIKGVADTVQPDLKNLGQDMADVYHSARDNVQKKIEPLAQTVRPYIEHAQKAVEPYVNQAREEVPKALGKVGEQVRGAWEKLTSGGAGQSLPSGGPSTEEATDQLQRAGDQIQHAATNAVQQPEQAVKDAASKVGA